ncbi:MAG TPA: hypothetical protein VH092_34230, partial [Urbifossiella sp.]|nr:hypothetical protein [Urbifossiella sp.]
MPRSSPRLLPAAGLVAAGLFALTTGAGRSQPPAKVDPDHAAKMAKGADLFKTSVRGILAAKCQKCHSGDRVEGEFDLGTREVLLKGGPGG